MRHIAQARGNHEEIEKIVNAVFFLKLLLLLFAFIIFILLVIVVPNFHNYFFIYLCSFMMVVGQTFLPGWYYQGIEEINKTPQL